jgi:aryl-alcohol dehydrogenase-like predicted oxidoreductase
MNTRLLGKTGYHVSEIGLGTWQLGGDFGPVSQDAANEILSTARSLGVNFWDTADVYGAGLSESRIGTFADKKDVFVATKLGRGSQFEGMTKYNKASVKESIQGSLQKLRVETLDLAQLHCIPTQVLRDGEIFSIMDDMQAAGLVRHWGASVENVEEALLCLKHPGLSTLQIIFNLLRQDCAWEVLPKAKAANVGVIVRLPLASGLLSGKWTKDTTFPAQDHRNYNRDGQAFNVGETFAGLPFGKGVELVDSGLKTRLPDGMTLPHFALRWILDHEAVSTVIAGVTKPTQLRGNVEASGLAQLTPEVHTQLSAWYKKDVRSHIRGSI